MAGDLLYLDTSALVKLVRLEAETEALLQFLAPEEELVTSLLTNIEVHRAMRRASSEPAKDAERIRVLRATESQSTPQPEGRQLPAAGRPRSRKTPTSRGHS